MTLTKLIFHFLRLQKALEMMYIVPKKANDMMNVGMLECFTVRELVILFCASADLLINHTIKRH